MMWNGWGGWMHGDRRGFGLVFWVLLGVIVVLAVRMVWRTGSRTSDGAGRWTALEILQRRYARGDISKDEFEQKRRDLS